MSYRDDECPGCGAPREPGQMQCSYCRRIFTALDPIPGAWPALPPELERMIHERGRGGFGSLNYCSTSPSLLSPRDSYLLNLPSTYLPGGRFR